MVLMSWSTGAGMHSFTLGLFANYISVNGLPGVGESEVLTGFRGGDLGKTDLVSMTTPGAVVFSLRVVRVFEFSAGTGWLHTYTQNASGTAALDVVLSLVLE